MAFILVFFAALILSLVLTPLIRRVAEQYGFLDVPGSHPKHVHTEPTARLGGVALYVAFFVAVALTFSYPRDDPREVSRLTGMLLGATVVLLMGIYDDHREIRPAPQVLMQFLAAAIAIGFGVVIREVTNPFGGLVRFPGWLAVGFTLFWLVGMQSTVNLLDGLDGLAAGITVIGSAVLFIHTYRLGQHSIALLPSALAGCALGFLPHNFHPARIFLGSSGAYFLGFTLGVLSIIGGAKLATALLVLGIPILDFASLIAARVGRGRVPWQADRNHLHHHLFDLGLSQRTVVLLYYLGCALFGGLALVLTSRMQKLVALVSMGILIVIILGAIARNPLRG